MFHLLNVDSLTHVQNGFPRGEVDRMADAMITLGCNLQPVIVAKGGYSEAKGDFEYEVLGNHLVAAAAQQARLLKPREWEMVHCYIVEKTDSITAIDIQMSM